MNHWIQNYSDLSLKKKKKPLFSTQKLQTSGQQTDRADRCVIFGQHRILWNLNWLPTCKHGEILHKDLDFQLLLKSQELWQPWT